MWELPAGRPDFKKEDVVMKLNLSLSAPELSVLAVVVAVVVVCIVAPEKADVIARALVDGLLLSRTK